MWPHELSLQKECYASFSSLLIIWHFWQTAETGYLLPTSVIWQHLASYLFIRFSHSWIINHNMEMCSQHLQERLFSLHQIVLNLVQKFNKKVKLVMHSVVYYVPYILIHLDHRVHAFPSRLCVAQAWAWYRETIGTLVCCAPLLSREWSRSDLREIIRCRRLR